MSAGCQVVAASEGRRVLAGWQAVAVAEARRVLAGWQAVAVAEAPRVWAAPQAQPDGAEWGALPVSAGWVVPAELRPIP